MIPLPLHELAKAMGARPHGLPDLAHATGVSIDTRTLASGDLFFAIKDKRDGHEFAGQAMQQGAPACVCTRNPFGKNNGATRPWIEVDDTVTALARLAVYYRHHVMAPCTRIVAVTGSNGKTTTKCMIDHVLGTSLKGRTSPKSFNNHLGVPLTLLSVEPDDRYLVVEIGSNAPGEVAELGALVRPDVAVITSIGEAHLEGFGDLSGVAAEKASLLDCLQPTGIALVNTDCPELNPLVNHCDQPLDPRANARSRGFSDLEMGAETSMWPRHPDSPMARECENRKTTFKGRLLTFGRLPGARLRSRILRFDLSGTTFELEDRYQIRLSIPGTCQVSNATAAFAVARWFGLDPAETIQALESFEPRAGRAKVFKGHGLTVVDDSYNANPTSLGAAIETLRAVAHRGGRRVLVMGDMLELGKFAADRHQQALRQALRGGIDVVVIVGTAMRDAWESLRQDSGSWSERETGADQQAHCIACTDAEAASVALKNVVSHGDLIWVKGSRVMELDRVVKTLRGFPFQNHAEVSIPVLSSERKAAGRALLPISRDS